MIGLLVFLQLAQQALGKNRVAVFFPFALFHPNHHPFGIDIAELEMDQLVTRSPAEYAVISKHRSRKFDGRSQQSLDLSGA